MPEEACENNPITTCALFSCAKLMLCQTITSRTQISRLKAVFSPVKVQGDDLGLFFNVLNRGIICITKIFLPKYCSEKTFCGDIEKVLQYFTSGNEILTPPKSNLILTISRLKMNYSVSKVCIRREILISTYILRIYL